MFNGKNHSMIYKVLSLVFGGIIILFIFNHKNIIDFIYISIVCFLVVKIFIKINSK